MGTVPKLSASSTLLRPSVLNGSLPGPRRRQRSRTRRQIASRQVRTAGQGAASAVAPLSLASPAQTAASGRLWPPGPALADQARRQIDGLPDRRRLGRFPSPISGLPAGILTKPGTGPARNESLSATSADLAALAPATGAPRALGAPIRADRHRDRGLHELSAPLADVGDRRLRRLARRDAAGADERDLPPPDGRARGFPHHEDFGGHVGRRPVAERLRASGAVAGALEIQHQGVTARRWKNEPTIAYLQRRQRGWRGRFWLFTAISASI